MKLDITKVQLESIKIAADTLSSMVGCADGETDNEFKRIVKNIDRMLIRNNLPKRDFN